MSRIVGGALVPILRSQHATTARHDSAGGGHAPRPRGPATRDARSRPNGVATKGSWQIGIAIGTDPRGARSD